MKSVIIFSILLLSSATQSILAAKQSSKTAQKQTAGIPKKTSKATTSNNPELKEMMAKLDEFHKKMLDLHNNEIEKLFIEETRVTDAIATGLKNVASHNLPKEDVTLLKDLSSYMTEIPTHMRQAGEEAMKTMGQIHELMKSEMERVHKHISGMLEMQEEIAAKARRVLPMATPAKRK